MGIKTHGHYHVPLVIGDRRQIDAENSWRRDSRQRISHTNDNLIIQMYDAWCMVHGAWCMVHGAWCMVHGAWCMVHGAWCMVHGAWRMAHGAWRMVHGAWRMAHGAWCNADLGSRKIRTTFWCVWMLRLSGHRLFLSGHRVSTMSTHLITNVLT